MQVTQCDECKQIVRQTRAFKRVKTPAGYGLQIEVVFPNTDDRRPDLCDACFDKIVAEAIKEAK